MKADEAKRLEKLENDKVRLQRLVAERSLDKQLLQEVVSGHRRTVVVPPACGTSSSPATCCWPTACTATFFRWPGPSSAASKWSRARPQGRHCPFQSRRADNCCLCWIKPERPAWLSLQEYEQLPPYLYLRAVRVLVRQPGFRNKRLVLVTTRLDAVSVTGVDWAGLTL